MADHTTSDQNASVADLEAEIAASRERLARNIDEIVFRAQPKTIIRGQKEQLLHTLKGKYHQLMGTDQTESTVPTGTAPSGPSVADLKAQAAAKAEDLKAQASAKAGELKATVAAKVDDLKGSDNPSVAPHTVAMSTGETVGEPVGTTQTESSDVMAQARVKADQARLKIDELTHTEDGDLRTDRIATALAAAGAVLVAVGAARRAGN